MSGVLSLLRRFYLTAYNWAVFAGWFQVLFLTLKTLKESGYQDVYKNVEKPLLLAQSAAFLEILHGIVGLVRSPISATLPQISSRLYVVWGILYSFPEVQTNPIICSLLISWCITEIIRYSFFGTKEAFGSTPYWLLWLRYNTFLVLYPTGISSEIGMIYAALPYMKLNQVITKKQRAHMFSEDGHICFNELDEKVKRAYMFSEDEHICSNDLAKKVKRAHMFLEVVHIYYRSVHICF